ncbi:MAG TPA: methylamine dehydrogenase (amicyanin) large subunit [Methylophilaceae bacterium]|jgi:methylamine dehydrogenase heavy chain
MTKTNSQLISGQPWGVRRLAGHIASIAALTMAQTALAGAPAGLDSLATTPLQDKVSIEVAPPSDSKRVYVVDPGHFNMTSVVFTIDGKNNKLLGMTDATKLPNAMVTSDGKRLVIANTMYSRVARGKRDDYVEVIDTSTHDPVADIDIPEGRFLIQIMDKMAALSTDDRHMFYYQFSPTPGVGMVDLQKKTFVKTLEVPDCYYVFPAPKQNFYMHCRDGSMLQVTYDDQGNSKQKTHKPFRSEKDFLMNNPYYSVTNNRLVWPNYEGRIFQAKLTASGAEYLKPIEIFTEKEKAEKWRPGGWQPVAYHKDRNEIYLLADQREKWTHKTPSRFVIVADATTGKRLRKIELKHDIDAIAVSQDKDPYLYAVDTIERTLHTFDAKTGKHLGSIDELGKAPVMLVVADK